MTRVALVPGVLALLPAYAGIEDPVPEVRAACLAAVSTLGPRVTVLSDPQGARVGHRFLELTKAARATDSDEGDDLLVVGNGSARRSVRAPGHLDARSGDFDRDLGASLRSGRIAVDTALGRELWAATVGIEQLAARCDALGPASTTYDDDPVGVQYWVMLWEFSGNSVSKP